MARAEDIVKAGSGAVLVWGRLPEDGSPAAFIHRCFSRVGWRVASLRGRLELCAGVVLWPLLLPAAVAVFTWYNGGWVRRASGKGIARQVYEQVVLAATTAVLPPWYYIFELYDDARRRRAGEYLNRFETKRFLYPFLREHNGGLPLPAERTTVYLSDKARFAEHCATFGLPAVPALLVIEHGRITRGTESVDALPEIDLFVKPLRGTGGRGAQRWEYQGAGRYRDHRGAVLSGAALVARLAALSAEAGTGYAVLPRLVNHPAMADLSGGALATVRAVTCRDEREGYEVTNASLRMAQGGASIVDNFHAGGIVAKIDLATGVLGPATDGAMALGPGRGWCERHPDSGAPIAGRTLPWWPETVELARRAHARAFSDHVVIGWDIAILADGPRLVEGNKGPDLDLVQKSHREPLGNARLGELLALHLRRALAAQAAARR